MKLRVRAEVELRKAMVAPPLHHVFEQEPSDASASVIGAYEHLSQQTLLAAKIYETGRPDQLSAIERDPEITGAATVVSADIEQVGLLRRLAGKSEFVTKYAVDELDDARRMLVREFF